MEEFTIKYDEAIQEVCFEKVDDLSKTQSVSSGKFIYAL